MKTVLITGGTGMLGSAIADALIHRNYQVVILSRGGKTKNPDFRYAHWDPAKGELDAGAISQADYIIHLAGANVGKGRWTKKRKQEILDSRVKSGELIAASLQNIPNKVKAVISASATGFYGPDPEIPNLRPFIEADKPANDFLGTVVQQWEEAIRPVEMAGKRLVIFRMGILLSREDGAYKAFRNSIKWGITPVLASGKQVISWLHIDDAVNLYLNALENDNYQGTYNAVAPSPVDNRNLMKKISLHLYKRSIPVAVPAPALKIALGEMSVEVLKSTTVSSQKLQKQGFVFDFPSIGAAIQKLEAS